LPRDGRCEQLLGFHVEPLYNECVTRPSPTTADFANLRRPVFFSILAAILTLGLKSAAYFYTGSVGLLSDAAESGVNLFAAVTAWLSLWYAAKPVDVEHTYGHKKIEYFSSGLEGVLILAAAVGIAWYAVKRLVEPQPLFELGAGVVVALAASAINLAVAVWLLRVARRYGSIVLEADGQHLMTDVWTSVALVAGLGLVALTGREWLDPVLAVAMSVNIFRIGVRLVLRSFDGLMDHALPPAEQALVRQAVESNLEPGTAYHALRTRQAGTDRFVDFHLLVPGRTSVTRAHRLAVRVEQAIRDALPGTEVVVHIEPIEEPASWDDSELLAIEQARNKG
jgi:cation diffusion facilitator family transporter